MTTLPEALQVEIRDAEQAVRAASDHIQKAIAVRVLDALCLGASLAGVDAYSELLEG